MTLPPRPKYKSKDQMMFQVKVQALILSNISVKSGDRTHIPQTLNKGPVILSTRPYIHHRITRREQEGTLVKMTQHTLSLSSKAQAHQFIQSNHYRAITGLLDSDQVWGRKWQIED